MTLLKRLDNLDILCHDADALAPFYHEVLGLPFFLPYEPGEGWFCVQAGDTTIYVFRGNGDPHQPRRTPVNPENPPGFDSIAFAVDDLDEAVAEYDGQLDWASDPITWEHPSGTWYRYRPFYDPEGNLMYLTEPHKPGS